MESEGGGGVGEEIGEGASAFSFHFRSTGTEALVCCFIICECACILRRGEPKMPLISAR